LIDELSTEKCQFCNNLHVPVPDADLASRALGAFFPSTWRFLLSPYLTFPPERVVLSVLPQQLASCPIFIY
jgi:hypothetical protein